MTREVDGGLETLALNLPAVVTTDLRLNEPRYASLPNIMKAKKKPIDTTDRRPSSASTSTPRLITLKVEEPPQAPGPASRSARVAELVAKLKNEAGVI